MQAGESQSLFPDFPKPARLSTESLPGGAARVSGGLPDGLAAGMRKDKEIIVNTI
jgi:hypothetical protein